MPASPSASVFINCPFDEQYQPLFEAIVFCVAACGFVPRCTLELTDAGEVRIENIYRLIAQCNHGIHDISRTEVEDQPYQLPRFNMPLELGIFLGAKRFGGRSSRKRCLILDRARYRYKSFPPTPAERKAPPANQGFSTPPGRSLIRSGRGGDGSPRGGAFWGKNRRLGRERPLGEAGAGGPPPAN